MSDGVRLALLNNRLQGVARAMQNTLARTGRSGVLNTARDFSCCILTADGELLATAESLPIHVMSGPDLTVRRITEVHPDLRPGDAFLHNSPYHGNSHAADHCLVAPVIDAAGSRRFFVLAKAHQADCGNSLPTTYHAAARDVYEEGALIFDGVRVQRDYADIDDVIRMCRLRIRVPQQWWGDYLALLGAARIGERRLLELGADVGWDVLADYTRDWFDYSEQRMAAALRQLPAGRTVGKGAHDPFPGVPEGISVKATVEIDPDQATVDIDLRDNPNCQPCGLNLTEATARTAAMIGVFNSIDHTVPANAGSFRRLRIHLRENCCVGIPRHPTSCSVATTNLADRVTNAIQRAIAELADGAGMAECGSPIPASVAVLSGIDPRTGEPFVNQIFLAFSGGAAAPSEDAWLTIGHVGNAGFVHRDSVEIDELHHPIRVVEQRLLPDTEGPGRYRGASSLLVEYGPIEHATLTVMYASDGTVYPARGARGGGDGAPSRQFKRERNGQLVEAPPTGAVVLEAGETIVSMSSGGGGYGPPRTRDPDRVRHDLAEGWISAQRARDIYGVEP
jgi:N-methylhydantoinase B/oxoprolinase/acetone carboxylase alpha subunit